MKKRSAIIAIVFMIVSGMTVQNVYAQPQVIDLESGAVRDGNFISVNKEFQTESGQIRQVFMTGLRSGAEGGNSNVEQFIKCLEDNYQVLEDGNSLKIIDEAFCDAEKWNVFDDGYGSENGRS